MKRVLSWVWFVSVWVAQILIVLYVFEHLVGRTEHIIVAILGLMYVATRLLAIVNMSFTFALHATTQAQLVRIRRLFNDDPDSMQEVATDLGCVDSFQPEHC